MVMSTIEAQPARASGEFAIGGEPPVVRLGYGSTQIPAPECGVSRAITTR
jgi:hypothetical protein